MAMKPVAIAGDATATAGAVVAAGADSGTWTAGPITESTYDVLTSGGSKVLYKAECTFSFSGKDSANAAVTDTSTVTLDATTKVLQGGGTFVLVDGDSQADEYDNTVSISASAPLRVDA